MATDYGTDLFALDDLTDPELLASGPLNLAGALCRRLLTRTGELEKIGETEPYDSIDLRESLGARFSLSDPRALDDLSQQCRQVLSQDPRVDAVDVSVTFSQGRLVVSADGTGSEGPFSLVLAVDQVSATILRAA